MGERFVPARYQPPLPLDRLILKDGAEGAGDRMELDVVIVGAGPAGLACAIELARLAKAEGAELNIGVLEKAEALGEHSLSGAVVNPRAFRELFPDLKDSDFPFRGPVVKEAVYLLTKRAKLRLPTRRWPVSAPRPLDSIARAGRRRVARRRTTSSPKSRRWRRGHGVCWRRRGVSGSACRRRIPRSSPSA